MQRKLFLADSAVTFELPCYTRIGGEPSHHRATLTTQWKLETGHDLEAERTLVAMGGYCSCLELATKGVKALRYLWLHRSRNAQPGVWRDAKGKLRIVTGKAPCCSIELDGLADAAGHLRSATHWAARYRMDLGQLTRFYNLIEFAAQLPNYDNDSALDGMPELATLIDSIECWQLGLDVDSVRRIHAEIGVDGGLSSDTYEAVFLHDAPAGFLAKYARYGPLTVDWVATHPERCGDGLPFEAQRWLDFGIHPCLGLRLADQYQPDEVHHIAELTRTPIQQAAENLSSWITCGCPLSAPEAEEFWRLGYRLPKAPGKASLQRLVDELGRLGAEPPSLRTRALILAAANKPSDAAHYIRAGARHPSDLLRIRPPAKRRRTR
jgi:hypothetical protein